MFVLMETCNYATGADIERDKHIDQRAKKALAKKILVPGGWGFERSVISGLVLVWFLYSFLGFLRCNFRKSLRPALQLFGELRSERPQTVGSFSRRDPREAARSAHFARKRLHRVRDTCAQLVYSDPIPLSAPDQEVATLQHFLSTLARPTVNQATTRLRIYVLGASWCAGTPCGAPLNEG